ncbi:mevalonate kinase, partial [Candidatus Micrarchaeota archaeon]|nr:mevalonate kinase [Candidatus Micrarchaeota archaeon]
MAQGKGFGKTILFGEHFVVYGLPAIAAALSNYTVAEVEEGKEGLEIIDERPATEGYKKTKKGERNRALELMLKYLKIDLKETPLKIRLSGNLFCASGIGASAAMATGIARALNEYFEFGLSEEQINDVSFEGEKGSAGTPSGIDNTCATFGGLLVFEKNMIGGKNKIERLRVEKPVEIVLANSGITQETKVVVGDVRALKEEMPEEFEEIFKEYRRVFDEALNALKENDWRKLGELMNKNQELL